MLGSNKGITITMLIIVIVVMIILSGSAIKITSDLNNESKTTTFASDLQTIEDTCMAYYAKNDTLPVINVAGINATTMANMITNNTQKTALQSEITEHNDTSDTFYVVDLEKISVTSTSRGTDKDGDGADRYYIASESKRVYYVKGIKVSGEYYFSLTDELTLRTDIRSNITEDTTSVLISGTTSSIRLTKNTDSYSNRINVSLNTTLQTGETLSYYIADISILTGQTAASRTFDIISTDITGNANIANAFATEANKVLTVKKLASDGTTVIAESSINIKNMDVYPPSFDTANQSAVINSYNMFNTLSFSNSNAATDSGGSQIKEIRYEYLAKKTLNGIVDYYTPQPAISSMDATYMLTYGKKSDKEIIKLPKYVKTVAVSWVDNAGNVSTPISFSITDDTMLKVE